MNNIIFSALENKCPLNNFSFLIFKMNTTIPNNKIIKMHIVYHWILHVHSISCKIEKCPCLVTVPTSFICCKARLVTNYFNLVCLHILNKTTIVTNNKIIAATNRKISTVCLSCKSKISCLCVTWL